MTATDTAPTATQIPQLDDYPPYAAASEKLAWLRAELSDLDAEVARLRPLANSTTPLDVRAAQIIAGGDDAGTTAVAREQHDKLIVRRRALNRAIQMQQATVDQVEREARPVLSRLLLPEYQRRLSEVLADLATVATKIHQMGQWLDDVNCAGIYSTGVLFPVVHPELLGDPREWNGGRLHAMVKEACENDLIPYSHPAAVACGIVPPRPPAPVATPTPPRTGPTSRQRAANVDDGTDDMQEYRRVRGRRRAPEPVASAQATAVAERAADAAADTY